MKELWYRICDWYYELRSKRCERCPLCASDWSDFHDTGYIGAYCSYHPKNEAEGCWTPWLVIWIVHRRQLRAEKKAIEYENQLYQWEQEHEREILEYQVAAEDEWYQNNENERSRSLDNC